MRIFSYAIRILVAGCFLAQSANGSDSLSAVNDFKLRARKPEWLTKILDYYPTGSQHSVLFYETDPQSKKDAPVKWIAYYPTGKPQAEADLLTEGDNVYLHGVALWYYPAGSIEKIAYYQKDVLNGPVRTFYQDGKEKTLLLYDQGNIQNIKEEFSPNGQLIESWNYTDNALNGLHTQYDEETGKKILEERFSNNLLEGEAFEWYGNGVVKAKYNYLKGLLHNEPNAPAFVRYYPDHTKKEKQDFFRGQPDGVHVLYHPNGQESYRATYKLGWKNGKESFWNEAGDLIGEGEYSKGNPVGTHFLIKASGNKRIAKYTAAGQLQEPIIELRPDGSKAAQYIMKDGKYEGSFLSWHANGQLAEDFNYTHGEMQGLQLEYDALGQLITRANFANGVEQGLFEEWYSNGQQAVRTAYDAGRKNGLSQTWDENGTLVREENYIQDLLEGTARQWNSVGALIFKGEFNAGKKQGLHQTWDEDGQLLAEFHYLADQPEGYQREWDSKGRLIYEAFYSNGLKQGEEKKLFTSGKTRQLTEYQDGKPHGFYRSWFDNGDLHEEKQYCQGMPIGVHVTYYPPVEGLPKHQLAKRVVYNHLGQLEGEQRSYYPDGLQQSQLTYAQGILHGPKKIWDAKGALIGEANYIHGRLEGRYLEITPEGKKILSNYKDNVMDGIHQVFHPPSEFFGEVKALEATYASGKLEGELAEFNEAGTKIASTPYVNGLKHGLVTLYDDEGRVELTAAFANDNQEGEAIEYYPSGKVHKKGSFKANNLEGSEEIFYPNGTLSALYPYRNGLLDGTVKEWNEKGVIVFEADYRNGKREGKFNKYYEDGSPYILQTFKDDVRIGEKRVFPKKGA